DPAEEAKGEDQRAPVGGLHVTLHDRVLRDVAMADHIKGQHGGGHARGDGDAQQGSVHANLRVSRPIWRESSAWVPGRKPARCRRATSSLPTATTCSRA